MAEQDEIMTTEEAAKWLKLHPETVRRMAASGELPARKVGKDWRFLRERLRAWLDVRWGTAEPLLKPLEWLEELRHLAEERRPSDSAVSQATEYIERLRLWFEEEGRRKEAADRHFHEVWERLSESAKASGYTVEDVPRVIQEVRDEMRRKRTVSVE